MKRTKWSPAVMLMLLTLAVLGASIATSGCTLFPNGINTGLGGA